MNDEQKSDRRRERLCREEKGKRAKAKRRKAWARSLRKNLREKAHAGGADSVRIHEEVDWC